MDETDAEIQSTTHAPVLLHEVVSLLAVTPNSIIVDCTAGGGGHAEALLTLLGPEGRYIGIDADQRALARVSARIGSDPRVTLVCGNFRHIDQHVREVGAKAPTHILADLGFSSDQLEYGGRGFSINKDEPLLMTFAAEHKEGDVTAWHVVNEWSEETLADIIFGFGGERYARKIARAICEAREERAITTSHELAEIVKQAVPKTFRKIHPATKTFQALRIAVNDELGALEALLDRGVSVLEAGGRIAIISFHSLEDRMVKHTFRAIAQEGAGTLITKHPVVASSEEIRENPRSRSAKLRVLQKME